MNVTDIFNNVKDFLSSIIELITQYFELFNEVIDILPIPFNYIIKAFLAIISVVLIVKILGVIT